MAYGGHAKYLRWMIFIEERKFNLSNNKIKKQKLNHKDGKILLDTDNFEQVFFGYMFFDKDEICEFMEFNREDIESFSKKNGVSIKEAVDHLFKNK